MKISCYLSQGCSSEGELKANISGALEAEQIEAEVSVQRIDDARALELKLNGSPSVFIDGKELQPQNVVGFG